GIKSLSTARTAGVQGESRMMARVSRDFLRFAMIFPPAVYWKREVHCCQRSGPFFLADVHSIPSGPVHFAVAGYEHRGTSLFTVHQWPALPYRNRAAHSL